MPVNDDTWWEICNFFFVVHFISAFLDVVCRHKLAFFCCCCQTWRFETFSFCSRCISNNTPSPFLTILGAFLWSGLCTEHDHCKKSQPANVCQSSIHEFSVPFSREVVRFCHFGGFRSDANLKPNGALCLLKMEYLKTGLLRWFICGVLTLWVQPHEQVRDAQYRIFADIFWLFLLMSILIYAHFIFS